MELGNRVIINQKGHFYNNCTGIIVGKRGLRAPGDPMYLLMLEQHRKMLIVPESMLAMCENEDADKGLTRNLFKPQNN